MKGSCKREADFWGQYVIGYDVVTMTDLGRGIVGSQDVFIVTDIYSGLRVAYPAPDKNSRAHYDGSEQLRREANNTQAVC